jgi:outer membrane protein, heavy metal efflux system
MRAARSAARMPDLTLGVFADREDEKDTLGVSLGIEIPLWNRNNGPIAESEANQRRAAAELRRRQLEQQMALVAVVGDYDAARAQADALQTAVLPLAEETLRLRTAGFANGDVSLTDLLEARRALLAAQTAALDARRRTAETLVRLGQVVGRYDLITSPTPASAPETTP